MATEEPRASKSVPPLFSLRTLLIVVFLAVLVCLFTLWWSGYGVDNGKGLVATLITIGTGLVVGEFIRQRFRYNLRQLLIAITLIAIFLGFFSQPLLQARKQRQVVETINRLTGIVRYKYDYSGEDWFRTDNGVLLPSWFLSVFGTDVFANVSFVGLAGSSVRDSDLQPFGDALKGLRTLDLSNTQITDAGLEHLKGLTNLYSLRLDNTQITDSGLVHLKGLTNLRGILWLSGTQVTDAGLEHLKKLTKLHFLHLSNTNVTDEGVKKLQQALPNCRIIR